MGAGTLDGTVAVITGAASGIGRAIAVAFAADGWRIARREVEVRFLGT